MIWFLLWFIPTIIVLAINRWTIIDELKRREGKVDKETFKTAIFFAVLGIVPIVNIGVIVVGLSVIVSEMEDEARGKLTSVLFLVRNKKAKQQKDSIDERV